MEHLEGKKVLIGLSGGINSMAVLCHLKELGVQPSELHLFYVHFIEHSPDTFKFVSDGVRFARKHFNKVFFKMERQSIISWFENQGMIPHPKVSPCSRMLKIERIAMYAFENDITIDLVGYVKKELKKRVGRQQKHLQVDLFSLDKQYPIGDFNDDWCFEITDRNIGWHPYIYDIKDVEGKRVFKHNNCLPCKNMTIEDMEHVKKHYPLYFDNAMKLSDRLNKYWGRDEVSFYTTFGRDLGQDSSCDTCKW